MTDTMDKNPFEFEALLKSIDSLLIGDQKTKLTQWRESDIAVQSEWERYKLNTNEDNAQRAKRSISQFLDSEVNIKSLIADLFLSIPKPEEAVNLFDFGKEKARRIKLSEDVNNIQDIVTTAYSINKGRDSLLSEYINNSSPSTDDTEPTTPDTNPSTPDTGPSPPDSEQPEHGDDTNENFASERSVNVWAFVDDLTQSRSVSENPELTDSQTALWISTLNTNPDTTPSNP